MNPKPIPKSLNRRNFGGESERDIFFAAGQRCDIHNPQAL
jgi:hypothetical protein